MMDFYDTDGHRCSEERYWELLWLKHQKRRSVQRGESDPAQDPTRIGSDHIGDVWVSTVWLGMDSGGIPDHPLIFETMIFRNGEAEDQWRWSTREEALAGHAKVVDEVSRARDKPRFVGKQ